MLGTWVVGIFLFSILLKVLPVIELSEEVPVRSEREHVLYPSLQIPGWLKMSLVLATAGGGIGMMAFGIATWSQDYAPVKWLVGIFMLCAVPLELCLLQPRREEAEYPELQVEEVIFKPVSVDTWQREPSAAIGPLTGRSWEP
ncbi:MAG: hypothetical protein GTO63_09300 [Anaerolineae bacterium]|nr:hypothetical protein [Anaerolineae bacterium]NIN95084.1 hypothetical protein [Anaerolineae bacterium]